MCLWGLLCMVGIQREQAIKLAKVEICDPTRVNEADVVRGAKL